MRYIALLAILGCLTACTSTSTKPIVDVQGHPLPGSIASLEKITLGGVPQWVLIRGDDAKNPILLKLHGGPGQAEMATVGLNRLLEKDFVVVEWDQRGAGKSAGAIEPVVGMTIDQFVDDTHALAQMLLARFHQPKLILVGHSWGGVIGLKAVQKYPDLYRAFVSTGQIVNFAEGTNAGYGFLGQEAERRQDADALHALKEIGPPPYLGDDGKTKRDIYGKWLERYGAFWHSPAKFDRVGWMVSSVEYA
jgi:pimeloyl-ACP methyl ester carboxylesterase